MLAQHVWEYCFTPASQIRYVPGQYAQFSFPSTAATATALQEKPYRTFTLSSHPDDNSVRFLTRLDPPLSHYKNLLAALQPGDLMRMSEPLGDVVLPRLATTPLVFVAQGIALASYLSMLTECAAAKKAHAITLIWARQREDDPLAQCIPNNLPLLQRVDFHYPVSVGASTVLPHIQASSLIYLSGSQTFVETLGDDLESSGVSRSRLIYDYYEGYPEL